MADVTSPGSTAIREQLERLAAFEPGSSPVISLYLDLTPDDRGRDRYSAFVRKTFAERLARFPLHSSERECLRKDIDRTERYLRDELKASANGLALFACSDASLFDALQLDAPIGQHWLFVGPVPHLYPLARIAGQFPRYAAVMLDTHQTRIFVIGLNTTDGGTTVTTPKPKRSQAGGWSQARYQRRHDNLQVEHISEVVDTLERIVAQEGITQFLVIGDEVAVPRLRERLTPELTAMLVDVIKLDRSAAEREVLHATLEALRGKDAVTDAERAAELVDAWRAGGLAAAGPAATLSALELGQVDELLIAAEPRALRSGSVTSRLSSEPVDATTSGGQSAPPAAALAVSDELVTRATQTGARITFIEDTALLASVGGVGAFLRFRLQEPT